MGGGLLHTVEMGDQDRRERQRQQGWWVHEMSPAMKHEAIDQSTDRVERSVRPLSKQLTAEQALGWPPGDLTITQHLWVAPDLIVHKSIPSPFLSFFLNMETIIVLEASFKIPRWPLSLFRCSLGPTRILHASLGASIHEFKHTILMEPAHVC